MRRSIWVALGLVAAVSACGAKSSSRATSGDNAGGGADGNNSATGGSGEDGSGGGGTVSTCNNFAACGGTLEGTWQVDATCGEIDPALFAPDDLTPECAGFVDSVSMEITGTAEYTGTEEVVDAFSTATIVFKISDACYASWGAPAAMTAEDCTTIENDMSADATSVACVFGADGCTCTSKLIEDISNTSPYTLSGSTVTYADGGSSTFCQQGDRLTMQLEPDPGEPQITLSARRVN